MIIYSSNNMANAKRDENGVRSLLGASKDDGTTTIVIKADNATNSLFTSEESASDLGPVNAPRDENGVPALIAVSSADGHTPVVVYANSSGELLIKQV